MKMKPIRRIVSLALTLIGLLILSGAIASAAHAAPLAQEGEDATLHIINESEETICYVYISPVTSNDWGDDWLGDEETISSEKSRVFNLVAGNYDVLLNDCDENQLLTEFTLTITE